MSISETLSPLIGRLVFGWFFFAQVVIYGGEWSSTVALMEFSGVPAPGLVLAVTMLLMMMGSLSLIFGFHARYGALMLFTVTIIATVSMHDYWHITGNPAARAESFQLFASNAAIAGGLLMLIGLGAGPVAIDNAKGGPPKKK